MTHAAPEFERFMGRVATDGALWGDFLALCGFGGRLAGSAGERAAQDWAVERLATIPGGLLRRDPVRYTGWTCLEARLQDLRTGQDLAVTPLLAAASTPAEGIEFEVVDCARGAPEQIMAAGVRGKAALVRHEYPLHWQQLEASSDPRRLNQTVSRSYAGTYQGFAGGCGTMR